MSNLNKFKNRVNSDKKLQKRMSEASTVNDVVEIAKDVGFALSADEIREDMLNTVSGGSDSSGSGGGMGNIVVELGDVDASLFDFSKSTANITQTNMGDNSTMQNVGSATVNRNKSKS